jgi:hypothetical protein
MKKTQTEIKPVIGRPFTVHVDQESKPEISNPLAFIEQAYKPSYSGNLNIIRYGQYKLLGYKYDFRHMLNNYLYKQYGDWQESWAPNEEILRKVISGKIDKIVKI